MVEYVVLMRHVYSGRDEMDAHFVKGLLEAEGIEAAVMGENLVNAVGTLPLSDNSLPGVWVPDGEEARAQAIVQRYKQVDAANANDVKVQPTWKCVNCGEAVEQQFTNCWKCGHARPEGVSTVDPADGPH
jgi:hypothetical protein